MTKRDTKNLKRVNVGLTEDDHTRLERLSFAVAIPKTILAADILSLCLSNPNIVEYVQQRYKAADNRKIVPIVSESGEVIYSQASP